VSVPTRRHLSGAPRATRGTAAATGEPPRRAAAAAEPQQAASATTAAKTAAFVAPSVLLASTPAGGNQAAMVEVLDDNVPPPGWGQWESLPAGPQAPGGGASDEGGRPRDVGALLTVKIRQPSHEFTFGVGITFVYYPLVLTPVV
jgi:hypothetical protein